MKQCPKCYYANNDASQYCESCGTPLVQGETRRPTLTYPELSKQAHTILSHPSNIPFPNPAILPHLSRQSTPQVYSSLPMSQEGQLIYPKQLLRKKSGPAFFFGILLYLIGSMVAAFGLASIALSTRNNTLAGAVFLIAALLEILALILILIFYHRSLLRGWHRIVLFFMLSILAGIAIVAVFASTPGTHPTTANEYIGMGITFAIYGFTMEVIAFL